MYTVKGKIDDILSLYKPINGSVSLTRPQTTTQYLLYTAIEDVTGKQLSIDIPNYVEGDIFSLKNAIVQYGFESVYHASNNYKYYPEMIVLWLSNKPIPTVGDNLPFKTDNSADCVPLHIECTYRTLNNLYFTFEKKDLKMLKLLENKVYLGLEVFSNFNPMSGNTIKINLQGYTMGG